MDPHADPAAAESTEPKGQINPIESQLLLTKMLGSATKCQSRRLEECRLVT